MSLDGLSKWFKKLFEELGWMVLAKDMGYTDKIREYQISIQRFTEAAENAKKELKDPDHVRDVTIMLDKIKVLEKHASKDFGKRK